MAEGSIKSDAVTTISASNYLQQRRRVLLAVDDRPWSKAAFQWFFDTLYQPNDRIILCHIPIKPKLSFGWRFLKGKVTLPSDVWYKKLEKKISETQHLRDCFEVELVHRKASYKIVGDNSAPTVLEGILKQAELQRANMIVIGKKQQRGFRGNTIFGDHKSVSRFLPSKADIPVLVCPTVDESDAETVL